MNKWTAKILIIAVITVFVALGCSDTNGSAKSGFNERKGETIIPDKTVNRTLMKVDKLTCGSCLKAISQKLSTIIGVKGLEADISRGLVAVDHEKTLESIKISDAINSIGYPATIISVTELESSRTITPSNSGQYGSGCCGGSKYSNTFTGENSKESAVYFNDNNLSDGCPYTGAFRSRGCYASSASWKELFKKLFRKQESAKE